MMVIKQSEYLSETDGERVGGGDKVRGWAHSQLCDEGERMRRGRRRSPAAASANQPISQSSNWAIGQSGNHVIGQSGNRAIKLRCGLILEVAAAHIRASGAIKPSRKHQPLNHSTTQPLNQSPLNHSTNQVAAAHIRAAQGERQPPARSLHFEHARHDELPHGEQRRDGLRADVMVAQVLHA
eukprot:3945443-Prymnesium_polylepis.1